MKAKPTGKPAANQLRKQAEIKLSAQKKKSATHPPTGADIERLVHELGVHQIELEMQNEELVRARAEAEAALNQYTELYDFAPVGYVTLARDGKIQQANLTAANLLGLERGNLIGKCLGSFVSKETRDIYEVLFQKLLSGTDSETSEIAFIKNDGRTIWMYLKAVCFEGRDISRIILTDITERKQANEMLRESEEKFHILNTLAPAGIYLADVEGNCLFTNPRWNEMTGLSSQEALGKGWMNSLHPDDREAVISNWNKTINSKGDWEMEYRFVTPEGKVTWVYGLAVPQIDASGKIIQFVGLNIDITERKRAENQLKENERNLRILNEDLKEAQAVAHLGLWKWDIKNGAVEWSDEMYSIFGIDKDSYTSRLGDVIRKVIHPDDLHVVLPDNAAEFAASKPQEYRIIRPTDGSIRHMWAKAGEAIFDEQGSPIYLTGIVQDATERKHAEKVLQESEEKYRSLFENMTEGYSYCQMLYENGQPQDWIYLTVNKTFEGLTGLKNVTGKRVSEVIPGIREADPGLFEIYSRVALSGKPEKFETYVASMQMWFLVSVYSPKKEYFVTVFDDITERKNFENELRQSEVKNRALLSAIPDLLFHIDLNGVVLDYHTPDGTTLYAPPEQFLNRNLLEVLPPYIVQQGMAAFEEAIRDNKMIMFEYELPQDGVPRFYENRVVPFSNNSVLSVIRDITERKQSGNAIRRHMAELELLYESGLALSQLLSPNQIGEKIIDLLENKMDWHHTIIRLYHPEDQSLELLAFNQSKNEAYTSEDRFVNHIKKAGEGLTGWAVQNAQIVRTGNLNNDPRYMPSSPGMNSGLYVPMMSGQRVIGVISIETEKPNAFNEENERLVATLANQAAVALENAQLYQTAQLEIDERKQIEALLAEERNQLAQRVEERTADLSRINRDLALAMRIKDEFLASMSHELRTPLTGILGLSEALQLKTYGVLSDKQEKTVKTIEESGRHLLELINDILDLSKIEAGMLELSTAPFLLEDICQSCLHLVKGMAQHKHQTVHYTPSMEPIVIEADARRIKQVLVNLLSNAVKFTPVNSELGLEVRLDETGKRVQLSVWDKGIGIKPQDMQKLFKPFTQIDSSLAREYNGTGLGLSLAQRLVDKHNGSIEVESTPGAGSRFTVSLPWSPQDADLNFRESETKQGFSDQTLDTSTPALIMITDDNEVLLEMLSDFLETRHYYTVKARSGIELLEKLVEITPDLILVDIQMPGLDGLETIRRIRAHPNPVIASTPLIAITALAMPGDREICLQAGANEYISKPVQLQDLDIVIQKQIRSKQ